jgi:two-component system cell cycle sensor histidine kinase/response regulator CckA
MVETIGCCKKCVGNTLESQKHVVRAIPLCSRIDGNVDLAYYEGNIPQHFWTEWASMKDEDETQQQLMAELAAMRQRIAELESAQAEYRRVREEHRSLVEHSLQGLVILQDGRIVFANRTFAHMIGYDVEELLALLPQEVQAKVYEEDRASIWERYQGRLEGKPVPERYEFRLTRKDGARLWVEMYGSLTEYRGQLATQAAFIDITQRKQAESQRDATLEALRESERKLDRMLQTMVDGMVVVNLQGEITYANQAAERILEIHKDDILGRYYHEREWQQIDERGEPYPLDQLPLAIALREEKEVVGLEHGIIAPDGEVRWLSVNAAPLIDESGQLYGAVASFRDITEHKQALRALQAEKDKAQKYLDITAVIMVALDNRGEITLINRKGLEVLGYAEDEIIGKNWFDTFLPDNVREATRVVFQKLMAGEIVSAEYNENPCLTKRGEQRVVAWHNTVVADETGGIIGTLSSGEDITERMQAEAALRESEEKYRHLFELESDAIFLIDNETGRILEVNTAASDLYGYSREELLQKKNTDLSAEPNQTRKATLEGWSRVPVRFHRNKDGTVLPVEITARHFTWRGRGVHVAAIRDITERMSLEEQLRQAQKMEAIGRLTAGIAHDFNNLLTAINGFAELMQLEVAPEDPLSELVGKILASGRRAADLVRQLLAFSRKQILEPRTLNLNNVVSNMGRMLHRIIGEHIDIETVLAPDLWIVKVDPTQIEQVIVNLAVNARDAMPAGGRLTIETANVFLDEAYAASHLEVQPGEHVLLAVSDTGKGMSEEVKAHIFEPFFTTKEVGQGAGLGLATVYGIVKQSGGHIWVYSEENQGTTFKIYLPRARRSALLASRSHIAVDVPTGREVILLVEDDESVRDLVRRTLQRQGYTVLEASNGQEALQLFTHHAGPIHLLLTDVVMPGLSGKALAEQLAKIQPNLRVLYMSGYTDNVIVQHGELEAGIAFLQKPLSPTALAAKVRQVLDAPAQG